MYGFCRRKRPQKVKSPRTRRAFREIPRSYAEGRTFRPESGRPVMNRTSTRAVLETPKIQCTADAQQPRRWGGSSSKVGSISDRWAWPHSLPVSGIARAVAGVIAFHANC